jgi:hypothetical protein
MGEGAVAEFWSDDSVDLKLDNPRAQPIACFPDGRWSSLILGKLILTRQAAAKGFSIVRSWVVSVL